MQSNECFSGRGVPWVVVGVIGALADPVLRHGNDPVVVVRRCHQDTEAPMPRVVAADVAVEEDI